MKRTETLNKDETKSDFSGLHQKVRSVADSYARTKGFKLSHGQPADPVDRGYGAKIAEAYQAMPHTPNDPHTKEAYKALIHETADQYNHIRSKGVKFTPMTEGQENPYAGGSKELLRDLHENNHMWYYPTKQGFGSTDSKNEDHPLMTSVNTVDGKMTANDVFRAVHDYFGHAKEGHRFGPSGEDAAWKGHMQMYSPLAQKALTTETRGQNSWVNFGPHAEHNRKNPQETIYADQKAGLLPDWTREQNTMTKSEDYSAWSPAKHKKQAKWHEDQMDSLIDQRDELRAAGKTASHLSKPYGEHLDQSKKHNALAESKSKKMKKDEKEVVYHPATHGGNHFIFSPEKPRVKPQVQLSPEEVLAMLRSWGETVEDTHGKYGDIERSFIVHDPKNIDKLHNLASSLGQESAIHSKDGAHEMHYYHGINAGKVRLGKGTQVFDEKPDDMYTKITDHKNQTKFFSHNFDWNDQGLRTKVNKKELSDAVYKSLNKAGEDRFNFQKYWNLILGDYTNNSLEKSLKIRTEDRVFVAMDGDNIGASVQRAAMADDLQTIIKQSQTIAEGQRLIRKWASDKDADIYIDGGDDIAFTLPRSEIKSLDQLRRAYGERTGFTITIGLGDSISHAGHAMLYGKLKGKNQVNEWKPAIDEELEQISQSLSPQEKMADHGLLGKDEIPGGLADKKHPSDFDSDKLKEGIAVEMEHTSDKTIATEIAMDHLTEDCDYYKKLKTIEKAEAPPVKPGQVSSDGRYISKHHKGAGMQAWHYNPEIANDYDKFIDDNKQAFVEKHPPEHQKVVSDFIDSVRGDFNRHFVISRDKKDGGDKIRARHVRGLLQGNDNYDIQVHNPNELSFVAFERHGNTPNKSSVWKFSAKSPQVSGQNADKGYSTATGGRYVSKSDKSLPNTVGSWNQPLGNDEGAVWGISELVQHRRYYGVSRRGSRLAKASSNGNVKLVHYGSQTGLSSIDPAHMGTGIGSRGLESKYGRPEVERSYYYREGSTPETVVTSGAKARYTAELQPHHSLYDLGTDPDDIHSKLKASGKTRNKGIVTSDEYLQAVKDAGHYGFYNSASPLSHAVALFYNHPVKQDESYKKSELAKSDDMPDSEIDNIDADSDAKTKIPTLSDHSEHQGKKVFVYFNLHKKLWSVRHKGKVLFHTDRVAIDGAKLKVSEAGRQRVLKEKAKNVHAGVEGTLSTPKDHESKPTQISYNPYKAGHFFHAGKDAESTPVHESSHVDMQLASITTPDGHQMNVPNVQAHNPKHHGFAVKQDGKKVAHDDTLFNKPGPDFMKSYRTYIWSMYEDIIKSKNVREQRKKVFGTAHDPGKNSPQRAKQLKHIKEQFKRRYGVPADVTPGKINSQGKPIDKPDWKIGVLNYQDNVGAAIHEGGHFEQIPEGVTMEQHQVDMDRQFGEVNRDYGYLQQKRTQGEIQPQAAENPIRRRLGLPANTTEVLVTTKAAFGTSKNAPRGRRPREGDEIPLSVDTNEPMAVRGKKNGKDVFLRRQSRLLSDENRLRTEKIDSGEIVYDKERGWVEGTSINAKINQRAREGAKSYFQRKLEEIKAKQGIEEPLASSTDEKLKHLKHSVYGSGETEQQAHERRIKEIKTNARAQENDPKKDPMKINARLAARDMKKADEPATIDYAQMNKITQKAPAPKTLDYSKMNKPQQPAANTIDYSKMNKPQQQAPANTLDYSKMNQITQKPEAPALNYSNMQTPAPPSASDKAKATNEKITRENSLSAVEEMARRRESNKRLGPTSYTSDTLPVSAEDKKSKIAKYFRSKLKIS